MQLASLERRIQILEWEARRKTFLRIHETETVPPASLAATYVNTHECGSYRVFVVPLRLYGRLRVFRASAVVRSALTDATKVDLGMAIYRYNESPFTHSNPILPSEPYLLSRVAILGTTMHPSPEVPIAQRFNADLLKEVTLDPRKGSYFVAYSGSEYGQWLCPGYGIGDAARRKGRQTGHVGENARDFPRELRVNSNVAPVPWIALRSSLGVRLYGDVANYG